MGLLIPPGEMDSSANQAAPSFEDMQRLWRDLPYELRRKYLSTSPIEWLPPQANPNAPQYRGGETLQDNRPWHRRVMDYMPTYKGVMNVLDTPLTGKGGLTKEGEVTTQAAVTALPGTSIADLPAASGGFSKAHQKGDLPGMVLEGLKGLGSVVLAAPIVGPAVKKIGGGMADVTNAAIRGERTVAHAAPVRPVAREGERLTGAFAPATAPVRGNTAAEIAQMQEQLPPKLAEQLADITKNNPEIAPALKYLTPNELEPLLTSKAGVDQFAQMLKVIPEASEMASIAKAGAPKQGWYRASTQAIMDVFGQQDAPRFAALLAATSPQNSVEMNLQNALAIWKNWTKAGRPTDPKAIKAVMGESVAGTRGEESVLDAWYHNTVRALGSDDPLKITLSGPKVDSFYRNLADDVYRVTNDAWMANVTGMNQNNLRLSPTQLQLARGNPGYSPAYLAMNSRVREGAEQANMLPLEGQETMWSFGMPVMNMQSSTGKPARQLLQEGLITPDVIRGTPDFSTLLKTDPTYSRFLEEAGYGDQLAALKPYNFPRDLPVLSAQDQRNVEKAAERLEKLRIDRDREKRSVAVPRNFNPPSTFAYQQGEAIPGASTGPWAQKLIDAPEGARNNFTGRVSAAQRDFNDIDIINQGMGLDAIATRAMQGVYKPDGRPVEFNKGYSIGAEVPVHYDAKGRPRLDPVDEQKLRTASIIRAANTAQDAVPYNAQVLSETGNNLFIPRKTKADPEQLKGLLDAGYSLDRLAPADTGAGINLLNFGERFSDTEASKLSGLLGPQPASAAPAVKRTAGAENPKLSYPALPWGEVGSRQVTTMELKELNKLEKMDPGRIEKLDTPEFRKQAADLHKLYSSQDAPPDILNRLRIISEGGIPALKKAMRGKTELLPAIAGLGLTGYLLDRAGQGGTQPAEAY